MAKPDSLYEILFEGESYHIENRPEWLKTSIKFTPDDDEFRDNLFSIWKATSKYKTK